MAPAESLTDYLDKVIKLEEYRATLRGIFIVCIDDDGTQAEWGDLIDRLSDNEIAKLQQHLIFSSGPVFSEVKREEMN